MLYAIGAGLERGVLRGDRYREAYIRHPHKMNDCHAFGPLVLCGQAVSLGMVKPWSKQATDARHP